MNLKNLLVSLVTITTFCGCASFNTSTSKRAPSSFSTTIFAETVKDISNHYQTLTVDTKQCGTEMRSLYIKLFDIVGKSVYFDMDNIEVLDQDIQKSFETRLLLKESLRYLEINSEDDKKCLAGISDVFKALRYIEDYMIDIRMDKTENAPTEYISMKGDFPYLLINPLYKDEVKSYENLKSGDAILSRGNAYSSATIARIGENDYQFSHLSFVYRDPNENNKMYTTEAHIEIGAVTAPFDEHLNEKNARSVVMRYNIDSEVAHKASEFVFNKVKKQSETGKNIEYDFSMNYKDESRLFCSEVVSNGFHHIKPNEDFIPKFKSHFESGLIPFLNVIGVPVNKTNIETIDVFAPGDIQFDPRFDLVMEWRNPKKMEESRFKDYILTKLFDKMSNDNFVIDPSFKMDIEAKTFWILRRFPIVRKLVDKKFPLNMSSTQMEVFMSLDKIGDILYKEVERKAIESDHPLTPKEVYEVLENYLASKPSELFKFFHPKS